eukprot:Skav225383  [mRNA]  locus=scaffold2656:13680:14977:- [translate_table: standard]
MWLCYLTVTVFGLQEVQMEHVELAKRAACLRSIYEPRYAFPEWSISELEKGNLESYAKTVMVYYPKGSSPEEVMPLVREREPVNIGMRSCSSRLVEQ